MASLFNSVLVDLEYLCDPGSDGCYWFQGPTEPTEEIENLRIFHLFARKWGCDDERTLSLLLSIEDLVSKIAPDIHHLRLLKEDDESSVSHGEVNRVSGAVRDAISSCEKMMHQWYNNFSNCSRLSWSSQDRDDEFLEFIDTILELGHSASDNYFDDWRLLHQLEALQEALIFLKRFIRFTTLQSIDDDRHSRQNLFTHIKVLTLSAAYIFYFSRFTMRDEHKIAEMQLKTSGLLQMIKPVDRRVHEIYIQALNGAELSRQSLTATLDGGDELILEDFTDSLLCYLFEILKADSLPTFSTKDQLQILDEGLRSLITILKMQPKNLFDDKMLDLTGMVRDAGVVIFSLFLGAIEDGLAKEMDVLLVDLLKRIKLVREKVTGIEKSPQVSMFNYPKADDLRFIDLILESLMEQTSCENGSMALAKQQIHMIYEKLMFLRPFLDKILKLRSEKEELQSLWNRVVELAYKVQFLIEDVPHDSSPMSFDFITQELEIIKLDALKIFEEEGFDVKMKEVNKKSSYFPSDRSTSEINDNIVALDDEVKSVKDRLTKGESRLQIVAIVGMPGLGKTTLAKFVYNDSSIEKHFHIRAWCCISQLYDRKRLLLDILNCISGRELSSGCSEDSDDILSCISGRELSSRCSEESDEYDLAQKLRQRLMRQRYLIVLDDMWDMNAWKVFEGSFPDDAKGSRIILTSRNANFIQDDKLKLEYHVLRVLDDDESKKLLKAKLFPQDAWPETLNELRTKVVERCKGIPLTIVIVAGILATMKQDDWKEVVEALGSSNNPILDGCKNILELSYTYLPNKLKSCFLYFGLFPEDYEHSANELTWLWIAEGFVPKTQSENLKSDAKDYLMHLINRNLVMVGKRNSTGGIKTCHIHDLLHLFCVEKAKEENFFQFFQVSDKLFGFNESQKLRRLCIHPKRIEDFRKSRLFYPRLRSLLLFRDYGNWQNSYFNPLCFNCNSKVVRVLDTSEIYLGRSFLDEIGTLVQLRYLAVRLWYSCSIPSSIANLSNLETFIVNSSGEIELPNTIGNLKKLRHVKIKVRGCFSLDTANIDNSLEEPSDLETFSTLDLSWKDMEKTIKKFPNIRKLKVILSGMCKSNKIQVLESLSRLESLVVRVSDFEKSQVELSFPSNLRKLTLSRLHWQWCKISKIGNLPNLEILKLSKSAFVGEEWNMEEAGQFPKLRFLGLYELDIVRWTTSEDRHFPKLQKVELYRCHSLKEIPARLLGDITNLQMIVASYCQGSVVSSIREIEKEQKDMGDEDLKVVIGTVYVAPKVEDTEEEEDIEEEEEEEEEEYEDTEKRKSKRNMKIQKKRKRKIPERAFGQGF